MTKIIKRSGKILDADFPSGKVIFHTSGRKPYILNKTAGAIWDFCNTPRRVDSVVEYLKNAYGVEPARAKRDAEKFIYSMIKKKAMRLYERKDKI
jgi:hypothetical protein